MSPTLGAAFSLVHQILSSSFSSSSSNWKINSRVAKLYAGLPRGEALRGHNSKTFHDPFRNNFLSDGTDRIIYSIMGTSTGSKPLKYPFLLNFGR
jgi:hypothetical protein